MASGEWLMSWVWDADRSCGFAGRMLQRESPVSFQISPDPDKILAPLPTAQPNSPVARVDIAALSFHTSNNDIAMQNA